MSAIYRSYEVLVEETASNHKTRGVGKTKKDFKPHFENTCRALKVTHELFQGAVCYYILCLDGLVKNECDKGVSMAERQDISLPRSKVVRAMMISKNPNRKRRHKKLHGQS